MATTRRNAAGASVNPNDNLDLNSVLSGSWADLTGATINDVIVYVELTGSGWSDDTWGLPNGSFLVETSGGTITALVPNGGGTTGNGNVTLQFGPTSASFINEAQNSDNLAVSLLYDRSKGADNGSVTLTTNSYVEIDYTPSGTTVSVGQATETDTADTATPVKPIFEPVGQTTETDTANAVTPFAPAPIFEPVGQATETDAAQAVAAVKPVVGAVGQATETDTADSTTAVKPILQSVGQATEADTAQAVTPLAPIVQPVGQATETDTSQPVAALKSIFVAVGQATETDSALATTPVKPITQAVGQATETDTANAVTPSASGSTTIVLDQDVSTNDGYRSGTTFSNTDTWYDVGNLWGSPSDAFFLFTGVTLPSGSQITAAYLTVAVWSSTGDAVNVVADNQASPSAPTTAADLTGRTRTTASVSWAPDGTNDGMEDTADISSVIQELVDDNGAYTNGNILLFLDDPGLTQPDGLSGSTYDDGPGLYTPQLTIQYTVSTVGTVGQASETDAAQTVTADKPITSAVGQATETDTAQAVTAGVDQIVLIGGATETDVAGAVDAVKPITQAVGQASESDTAQAVAADKPQFVSVGQTNETDTAQAIGAGQGIVVAVNQTTETNTAATIVPLKPQTIAVGQAAEGDSALPISTSAPISVVVTQATETSLAQPVTYNRFFAVGRAVDSQAAQSVLPIKPQFVFVRLAEEADAALGYDAITFPNPPAYDPTKFKRVGYVFRRSGLIYFHYSIQHGGLGSYGEEEGWERVSNLLTTNAETVDTFKDWIEYQASLRTGLDVATVRSELDDLVNNL